MWDTVRKSSSDQCVPNTENKETQNSALHVSKWNKRHINHRTVSWTLRDCEFGHPVTKFSYLTYIYTHTHAHFSQAKKDGTQIMYKEETILEIGRCYRIPIWKLLLLCFFQMLAFRRDWRTSRTKLNGKYGKMLSQDHNVPFKLL